MSIKKQEFYEGAALHQIIRGGAGNRISYQAPFFVIDKKINLYLKYSTAVRSPWKFTFTPEEQNLLCKQNDISEVTLGLICGSDGIVALNFNDYKTVATRRDNSVNISCYRGHKEHYEVSGPDAILGGKIPPSSWQRLLKI